MLKQYIDRDSSSVTPISVVSSVPQEQSEMNSEDMNLIKSDPASSKLQNSDILKDPDQKLSHLDPVQRKELKQLIHEYQHLFPDIPTRTDKNYHDVNVEDSQPVKQHPYRTNPTEQKYLKEEFFYFGNSKYITIFGLLTGFWQIPLTERAKKISAFVTLDGLYHYKVMPFGMKISPATFQC